MNDSARGKSDQQPVSDSARRWGNYRKAAILLLFLAWLIGYFLCIERINIKSFAILAALVFLYVFDLLYSIALSAKASEFFKAFLIQTAVPLSALFVVAVLAYSKSIDSQATITMFGLSLAYTTYVVGRRIK